MGKIIAKLRPYADLAFSLFVIYVGLLLLGVIRPRLRLQFIPVFLFTFTAFLNWLYFIWQDVWDFFVDIYRKVRALINLCYWQMVDICYNWYVKIQDVVVIWYDNLKELVHDLWNSVHRFFVDLWTSADFLLVKIFERLNYLGETVWSRIDTVTHAFWGQLYDTIVSLYWRFERLCRDGWDRLMQYIYVVYEKLYDIGYTLYDRIKSVLDTGWDKLRWFIFDAYDRAYTILHDRWDWLMALGTVAVGDVIGLVTAKWPNLAWFFTEGWDFWAAVFTDPKTLVYVIFDHIKLYRNTFRSYLYEFSEHFLRFLWEGVW